MLYQHLYCLVEDSAILPYVTDDFCDTLEAGYLLTLMHLKLSRMLGTRLN